MAWVYDIVAMDLVWRTGEVVLSSGSELAVIDFSAEGDLVIDTGDRENTLSVLDEGLRVI